MSVRVEVPGVAGAEPAATFGVGYKGRGGGFRILVVTLKDACPADPNFAVVGNLKTHARRWHTHSLKLHIIAYVGSVHLSFG